MNPISYLWICNQSSNAMAEYYPSPEWFALKLTCLLLVYPVAGNSL
jgi:hypothetical protein